MIIKADDVINLLSILLDWQPAEKEIGRVCKRIEIYKRSGKRHILNPRFLRGQ